MGQKVSPHGLRVGVNKDWSSKGYPSNKKDFAIWLGQDDKIRKYFAKIERKLQLSNVVIERTNNNVTVNLYSAATGVVLGENGNDVKAHELAVKKITGRAYEVEIKVIETQDADVSAKLLANEMAVALENRASFRNVQKQAMRKAMMAGAKGIKTQICGRLGGADMARCEGYTEGSVPTHTLRADIDYATAEALTTYGQFGIKVWVYRGQFLNGQAPKIEAPQRRPMRRDFKKDDKKGGNK